MLKPLQYLIRINKPLENAKKILENIKEGKWVLPLNGLFGFDTSQYPYADILEEEKTKVFIFLKTYLPENCHLIYAEKNKENLKITCISKNSIITDDQPFKVDSRSNSFYFENTQVIFDNLPYYGEEEKELENKILLLAKKNKFSILYIRPLGAINGNVYKGQCFYIHKDEIVFRLKAFQEDFCVENSLAPLLTKEENQFHAIVLGIQEYMAQSRLKKVCIGLSGGMDSALVAPLAVAALGKENVQALLMPSRYSSDHSIKDSIKLAENLGIEYAQISIEDCFTAYEKNLNPYFKQLNLTENPFDTTFQNIQSRIRGQFLMALSNKIQGIVLGTGNKSEIAMGYSTLYGDTCAGIFPIGDLYKTAVYNLAYWYNTHVESLIPENCLTKAPSAELAPSQKDEDTLPAYDLLDTYLEEIFEKKQNPYTCSHSFTIQTRKDLLRRIENMEFKRQQSAPIVKLSSVTFGKDLIFPDSMLEKKGYT